MSALMSALPRAACSESLLDAGSIDFTIMSPDGRISLGRGRYTIHRENQTIVLHGESRYNTGEYDVETDTLVAGLSLPILQRFDHLFYAGDGSLVRAAHADLTEASASCMEGPSRIEKAREINFPSNTWAGASVLIPIQQFLQSGGMGDLDLHVFNCTSKPEVFSVTVSVATHPAGWPYSPGGAVQVNVKPHFGWFDVFIAPFIPRLSAWFDPGTGWGFEGVAIARYYRGPQILIVRNESEPPRVLIPADRSAGHGADGHSAPASARDN